MTIYLYIAFGGALGAVLRHSTTGFVVRHFDPIYPVGTPVVNIIGSFLIGFLVSYFVKTMPESMNLRAFLVVGMLGGFTTFSAFSLDILTLFERGQLIQAALYAGISVFGSIAAVFAGFFMVKYWV